MDWMYHSLHGSGMIITGVNCRIWMSLELLDTQCEPCAPVSLFCSLSMGHSRIILILL